MPIYTNTYQIGADLVRQFRERVPTQKIYFCNQCFIAIRERYCREEKERQE